MHGAGNDYIYLDRFAHPELEPAHDWIVAASDRHFGVGSDGVIVIEPGKTAPYRMRMWNADASESEMCGNGLRCVAKLLFDRGYTKGATSFTIQTGAGDLAVSVIPDANGKTASRATIDLGVPIWDGPKVPCLLPVNAQGRVRDARLETSAGTFTVNAVSMGNPHCVITVDDPATYAVHTVGPVIERHAMFPNRTNVEFIKKNADGSLTQRTWERGSGETLACGTGAGAVFTVARELGWVGDSAIIHLRGGTLELAWTARGTVALTGPAAIVFDGTWSQGTPSSVSGTGSQGVIHA
jgi:diaminopimelate epimerase